MGILSLPEEFETRMEAMLGEEEYAEFLSAFERERSRGLRLNPLKLSSALRMECERNPGDCGNAGRDEDGVFRIRSSPGSVGCALWLFL